MSEFEIGLARADEVSILPRIEQRAAMLFSPEDLAPEHAAETTPLPVYAKAQLEGRILVARDTGGRVAGFAHMEWVDGVPHLEELDVEPDFGRRGIGRRLVEAACEWARKQGSDRITLSTFRDVPWNAPFYARLGFEAVGEEGLTNALRALREQEARDGLDPAKRIVMARVLSSGGASRRADTVAHD